MNVFIVSALSISVFLELAERYNKHVSLVVAIVVALIVYGWIVYNHKLKAYIEKQQGTVDE